MEHGLIETLVFSLVFAFIGGALACKLNLPIIFGYLLAGVAIGPHTPGFVADIKLANQLAEIGIILLMFGVGLHFSPRDLLKVKGIAIPGAVFQMAIATLIGMGFVMMMGVSWLPAMIFGVSLSVASTIVLLRTLEERGQLDTQSGRIAVGWLIVEDIMMVLILVLLPVIIQISSSQQDITIGAVLTEILSVMFKIGMFFALMFIIGSRVLPRALITISGLKSHELMTLGTLAIALGIAFLAYNVFGASLALGAFMAGLILNESGIGHKAAEQSMPLRDAFAVLFFVSVGMLFDPMTMIDHPILVLATLSIIIAGKAIAALFITHVFKQDRGTSLTIAYSLAQIGEFSFILAGIGLASGLLDDNLYNLILAGALLSIAANPFLFRFMDWQMARTGKLAAV